MKIKTRWKSTWHDLFFWYAEWLLFFKTKFNSLLFFKKLKFCKTSNSLLTCWDRWFENFEGSVIKFSASESLYFEVDKTLRIWKMLKLITKASKSPRRVPNLISRIVQFYEKMACKPQTSIICAVQSLQAFPVLPRLTVIFQKRWRSQPDSPFWGY